VTLGVKLPDSCHYTPAGRRLLVTLGVVTPDPLRVEAEAWLLGHEGPMTEAVLAVRKALGPRTPPEWIAAADAFRNTPWKASA
jgi:hypothetical protein